MSKKVKFESICADYSTKNNHIFHIDRDYNDYDCVDTCVIWNRITFYGLPMNLSEEQQNQIYDGNYHDAVKIGELLGCLILCKQILEEGIEPLEICDDVDGDLEYTISALSDEGGPLNKESGDPYQDVFYILELKMEKGYDNKALKSRIINELPELILTFFHVAPELLAFYPSPMNFTPDPDKEVRYHALQGIAAQKMESVIDAITERDSQKNEDGKILRFGDAYKFSEDELNFVMSRRHSGSSYPEAAKDKKEYTFYEANGFEEAGDSRLLYKYVGR